MLFVRKEEQVLQGAFDHPRVELIPAALLARPRALRIAAVAPSTIMRPERVASRCAAWRLGWPRRRRHQNSPWK